MHISKYQAINSTTLKLEWRVLAPLASLEITNKVLACIIKENTNNWTLLTLVYVSVGRAAKGKVFGITAKAAAPP